MKKVNFRQYLIRLQKWCVGLFKMESQQPVLVKKQKTIFIPNAVISRIWHEISNLTENKGQKIIEVIVVDSPETPVDQKKFDCIIVVEYTGIIEG
jgi:hypothetical protein